ncbi:MAG: hypothetical protein ACK5LG_22025 [Bacteroides thetaiotaomicron]
MIIRVAGLDPSFRNWGIAVADLDLDTGCLSTPWLHVLKTGDEPKAKQARVNSYDISAAKELSAGNHKLLSEVKIFFVEVPVGSQSAAGMKAYGVCVGILGYMRALDATIIEVTAAESKKIFAGTKTATKQQMIDAAIELYPDANWPKHGGKVVASTAEHMADAIAAIHAGVLTPEFTNLLTLLNKHS